MIRRGVHIVVSASLGFMLLAQADQTRKDSTAERGAQIYQQICQGCHMREAEGAIGAGAYPALASNPRLLSWQYVAVTVLLGKNAMPRLGASTCRGSSDASTTPQLSDEEIADVVNYVRRHFGNAYPDLARVDEVAALPHPSCE